MPRALDELVILRDAPISTWFRVGGCADRLAKPASLDQLRACIDTDPGLLVLGDGANLLVDDGGVGPLVVELSSPGFSARSEPTPQADGTLRLSVGAGVRLPRLISDCVASGLGGLERLAGFPASIGGAVRMNAGGAFGEIADVIASIAGVDRQGRAITLEREQIDFGYRRSGLESLIITEVELSLRPAPRAELDQRRREVMEHKKASQPLSEKSAGCCFKNPTLACDVDSIGAAGERVSAGLVIDRAGGKGIAVGGARVSEVHANFIVTEPSAKAGDVIRLIDEVRGLVQDRFGIDLHREVVVWGREGELS